MITFSNGYALDFACASGALAFDGRGWFWEWPFRWLGKLRPEEMTVVIKTLTWEPKKGNLSLWHPWTCVRLLKDGGAVNAIGLTNPGFHEWVLNSYGVTVRKNYDVALSIYPSSYCEARLFADAILSLKLAYVEWNISCPNLGASGHAQAVNDAVAMAATLKDSNHPIVAKISYAQAMDQELVRAISPFVEAFHAINTVPWDSIYPCSKSPIEKHTKLKGGVSGPPIKRFAISAVEAIRLICEDKPIIGGGGIQNLQDVYDFQNAGTNAFSIGTLFIRKPWKPNEIIGNYRRSDILHHGWRAAARLVWGLDFNNKRSKP